MDMHETWCLEPLWSCGSILPASMIDILARDDLEDYREEVETDKDYHELLRYLGNDDE